MSDDDTATVLAAMLAAAVDDLALDLSSRDAHRLATRVVELLALAGYALGRDEDH